jgi:hypothetical protein
MKTLLSVALVLALTLAGAAAAPAHVVEMTTSVTLPAQASEEDMKEAVASGS